MPIASPEPHCSLPAICDLCWSSGGRPYPPRLQHPEGQGRVSVCLGFLQHRPPFLPESTSRIVVLLRDSICIHVIMHLGWHLVWSFHFCTSPPLINTP